MAEKKYIEFLLHNKKHISMIKKLNEQYNDIENGIKFTDIDEATIDKKYKEMKLLVKEVKKLVEENYYYDADIDAVGLIDEAWEDLITWENPQTIDDIINVLEKERTNRHKRKRKYSLMWSKLEQLGLDKQE